MSMKKTRRHEISVARKRERERERKSERDKNSLSYQRTSQRRYVVNKIDKLIIMEELFLVSSSNGPIVYKTCACKYRSIIYEVIHTNNTLISPNSH